MAEREDSISTLSERLEIIEKEIGRLSSIVSFLKAEYDVKHVDRPNLKWYDLDK